MSVSRLLVANRGEIARRVLHTCRRLGIETVAVFSDADAGAPYVEEADRAVRLPGSSAAATYLRGDLLVAAARASGADAVHPGYGFLSEDAAFAAAVVAAGLTWVGPRPSTIADMGSKVRAKELMAAAGVPVLSDAGRYPLLVKASAGGGGRGMRIVERAADLEDALTAAATEAQASFGDPTVFVEAYLPTARHVEVQVLADQHGTCWVLGDRDCSLQRRHQKVVEESPAPVLAANVRATLHDAARAAVKAVGYLGAGTLEFLVDGDDAYFIEMNTRLQVEHPVTECVTGLDLVALQIAVAEGKRLDPDPPSPRGHAIEARIYAEDLAADFAPDAGPVRTFDVPGPFVAFENPAGWGLRVDSGVVDGCVVSVHYDAMLAKVVAWAASRDDAVRMLGGALRRTRVHGVRTNLDLLVATLADPDVLAGRVHTTLLTQRVGDWSRPRVDDAVLSRYAAAAALAQAHHRAADRRVQRGVPPAFRNVVSRPRTRSYRVGDREVSTRYADDRGALRLVGDDVCTVDAQGERRVRLEVDGVLETYDLTHAEIDGAQVVDVDGPYGSLSLVAEPRFVDPTERLVAGSLLAPMPGTVVTRAVQVGQRVGKGEVVVVLEAMKMQHPMVAPAAGVVSAVPVETGAQVAAGAVLAVIEADGVAAEEGGRDGAAGL